MDLYFNLIVCMELEFAEQNDSCMKERNALTPFLSRLGPIPQEPGFDLGPALAVLPAAAQRHHWMPVAASLGRMSGRQLPRSQEEVWEGRQGVLQ
jgi:hypothetical protein